MLVLSARLTFGPYRPLGCPSGKRWGRSRRGFTGESEPDGTLPLEAVGIGRPHPLTPYFPRTHHAICPTLRIPKVEGMECVGGPVRAKKKSRRATARWLPPHTPTGNIARRARVGRPVCAQKRLFFRSPIRRLSHMCPTQCYIRGSGGARWPTNHVGSFFRSHRNQCSPF